MYSRDITDYCRVIWSDRLPESEHSQSSERTCLSSQGD